MGARRQVAGEINRRPVQVDLRQAFALHQQYETEAKEKSAFSLAGGFEAEVSG